MIRRLLLASAAGLFGVAGTTTLGFAHSHHYFQPAYFSDNGMLVGAGDENDENDADVVAVAEPVSYATVENRTVYQTGAYPAVYQTSYVAPNDTIVTPYGYTPYYNNGYYQGYAYDPRYTAYNPYYVGAAYGNADPVSAAVVNTVLSAAVSGGHVDGRQLIQSVLGAFMASQMQQQYRQQYQQQYPQYSQPVYDQPQQFVQVQQVPVQVQSVVPVQLVPIFNVRHGDREHQGEHGDHGDHGGND